ncbi:MULTISPECIES: hypothetical protein [Neobacillus]|uniref:Uncharacterized protein n=2 Tax=Neobacillus TaxID=2675232 RepID=A0A942U6T1_9BACI|nr:MULTISPECIES: hypothetical protein [Neobacillus]MBS4214430.1 hypothetical protein [Neobacillus rhizophilus]MCH6264288.1 hypothetical protein [Neobacillus citreus]
MDNNTPVIYNGKRYVILFKYTSGYCEIKEVGSLHHIELVHLSELTDVS